MEDKKSEKLEGEIKNKTIQSEVYDPKYTMKFENCSFINCIFNQTGKPGGGDPPPGTGGGG